MNDLSFKSPTSAGNCTITAITTSVLGETDLSDNTRAGGRVRVAIPGGVNGDSYVGIDDILEVASHFGIEIENPDYSSMCDIIDDGYIGIDDIFTAASRFGQENP